MGFLARIGYDERRSEVMRHVMDYLFILVFVFVFVLVLVVVFFLC
jgi:hypothetical protein